MNIVSISPYKSEINPGFNIEFYIDWYQHANLPIAFSGYVSYFGNRLGRILQNHNTVAYGQNKSTSEPSKLTFSGYIQFNYEELLFLHENRLKQQNNDVELRIHILLTLINTENHPQLRVRHEPESAAYRISASDWTQVFCPALNLGSYTIIEIGISELNKEIMDRFEGKIVQIKKYYDRAEWQSCTLEARKFFEDVRDFFNKNADAIDEVYNSKDYIKNLRDMANNSFDALSKYVHSLSRSKDIIEIVPAQNDAHMALFLSLAFFELIKNIESKTSNKRS